MYAVLHVLLDIVLELVLIEERCLADVVVYDNIEVDSILRCHELPSAGRLASVHPEEKLSHRLLILDNVFDLVVIGTELELIAKLRKDSLAELLGAHVVFGWWSVRSADAEDV